MELKPAEMDDADILTETCRKAFDSDSEYGAPRPSGPLPKVLSSVSLNLGVSYDN